MILHKKTLLYTLLLVAFKIVESLQCIFKKKSHSFLHSDIVYKLQCGASNGTCYGKTKHHFKVRMCDYLRVFCTHWQKNY